MRHKFLKCSILKTNKQTKLRGCISLLGSYDKVPHAGSLNNRKSLSQFWRLEGQHQGVGRVDFFWSLSPWLRWISAFSVTMATSCSIALVSLHGLSFVPVPSPQDTTPMASLNINYLFNDSFSKYSYILRYWRLGLQHMNGGLGDTIQSITGIKKLNEVLASND